MIDGLKPYPAYKHSDVPWLGRVPTHWHVWRLKRLFREVDVRSSTGSEVLLSLRMEHGLVRHSRVSAKPIDAPAVVGFKLVEPGQLVVNRMRASIGVLAIAREPGLVSPDYAVFDQVTAASSDYYLYLLKSPSLGRAFKSRSKGLGDGSAGFLRLYADDFYGIGVVAPPLSEQSAIVRFLDHADRRIGRYIRAKQQLIKLLEEQKQAIIHRAVTRGLDPNVRLKRSGVEWLGEVPEHWGVVPLKSISTVQSGVTLGKRYVGQTLVELPYLRVANVQSGHLDLSEMKTLAVPEDEAARNLLQAGDVLMTEGGDPDKLGRGCVWDAPISPCLHQNHVFAVRPLAAQLRPHFLAVLLQSQYAKHYFLQTAKQTTNLASTNKTTIGRFPVLLPDIEEQDAILRRLESRLREAVLVQAGIHRELTLVREYRTRLIADVVTGKVDVREAGANLPDEHDDPEPPAQYDLPVEDEEQRGADEIVDAGE
jgi:type I restriction enzyme S subunit